MDSSCSISVSTSSSYKYAATWSAGGTINATSCTLQGYYGAYSTSGTITASSSCTIKSCTYGAYATGGTIYLNGCTATSSITYGAYSSGGTVNVYGSTSISASSYALDTRSGGKIYVYGSASVTSTGSYGAYVYGGYLELYGSATITGSSYGVYVYSSSSSEFIMGAGTVKGTRALYQTNGTADITGGTLTSTSSYTIYQTGGTLSCTATFSTAQNHQIYEDGGTATFTNCSVNGGSSYYALYLYSGTVTIDGSSSKFYSSSSYAIRVNSGTLYVENGNVYNSETSSASSHYVIYNNTGTVYIDGGNVYNGSSLSADSSETTAMYTIYNNTGKLYLRGGVVKNNNKSSSTMTYAVYNYNGNVYGQGTELYHYNYGYAFYNNSGYFNLDEGKYHSYYGIAIYIRNATSVSYIGGYYSGSSDKNTAISSKSGCYIYRNASGSSYTDPIVTIAGGTVYIYGCYIESNYSTALNLTGSPTVYLGYPYSGGSNSQTNGYTPMVEALKSGQYPIYVNLSGGQLTCYEADIYGVDYGVYIADGSVQFSYVWITVTESTSYEIYVKDATASHLKVNVSCGYFYGPDNAKNVYLIYVEGRSSSYSPTYTESSLYYNGTKYTSLSGNSKPGMRT